MTGHQGSPRNSGVERPPFERKGWGAPAMLVGMLLVTGIMVVASNAIAQQRGRQRYFGTELADPNGYYVPPDFHGNHAYDGHFTFARIKYRGFAHFTQEGPGWSHDYPRSDSHMMMIMREVTSLRPFLHEGNIHGGNIFALDDPELCKYPVAYFSEPGGWNPDDKEVAGFAHYLLKGGFVIMDDFGNADDWYNVIQQMQRVLPKAKILPLDRTHPIFDSFFKIDPDQIHWGRLVAYRGTPALFAIFEDNDPRKRPYVILNYNLDIGESWEYSDEGFQPVSESNEAYKLGVNYLIYALTH